METEDISKAAGYRLEPFQRRVLRAINAPENEVLILMPRGMGKTTLAALDAVHHFLTVEDARVFIAASSEKQANLLFGAALEFVRAVGDPHVIVRHDHLRWSPECHYRTWTRELSVKCADWRRLHGLTYSRCYVDELQVIGDERLYDALASALHKRADAKLVTITTAGQGADSPLGRLRARALAQPDVKRRGVVTEASGGHVRMLEWSLPLEANVDDARVVKRVNPASWITIAQLAEQRERLPDLAYRRFICNQWTERAAYWLPPGAWQSCIGEPNIEPGAIVYVGVDVGGQRSATAVAWVSEDLHAGVWVGHGDEAVLEARDVIRELAERYSVAEVVFDPWRAGQIGAELEQEGVRTVAFPQSDSRMIPASERLYSAVVERRIVLPDHAELHSHAANTVAKQSRRGWRIDKPSDATPNDAVIALCMAVDAAENRPAPVELVGWL